MARVAPMRALIKFCGMTRRQDLEAAVELGADAVGLSFVAGTPRGLEAARARELLRWVPPFLARVGVFADEDPMRIRRIRDDLGLTAVQLDGSESPGHCAAVGGVRIKTFRVRPGWDPASVSAYDCEAFRLETPASGGGEVAFDWTSLRESLAGRRIVLAGGLTPESVAGALRALAPYAVDVCGGVESSPGVKDRALMERFVAAVRDAAC